MSYPQRGFDHAALNHAGHLNADDLLSGWSNDGAGDPVDQDDLVAVSTTGDDKRNVEDGPARLVCGKEVQQPLMTLHKGSCTTLCPSTYSLTLILSHTSKNEAPLGIPRSVELTEMVSKLVGKEVSVVGSEHGHVSRFTDRKSVV